VGQACSAALKHSGTPGVKRKGQERSGTRFCRVGWQYERATLAGEICEFCIEPKQFEGQPTTRMISPGG